LIARRQAEAVLRVEFWKRDCRTVEARTDLLLIVSSTVRSPTIAFMEEESLKLEGKASVQLCKSAFRSVLYNITCTRCDFTRVRTCPASVN